MRIVKVSAASQQTTTTMPSKQTLKALNITKSSLIDAQGGRATRNIDGIIYTIQYDEPKDTITVIDRVNRTSYDVEVGQKDNRISLILESSRPISSNSSTTSFVIPSFEQLQSLLRGDGKGAELMNGRVAMAALLGVIAVEAATGQSFVTQISSPAGGIAALSLATLTVVASIAPAFTGAVSSDAVLPDANDPCTDRQLPYFWTPLAEIINGRVAMVGMAALIVNEVVFRGGAAVF